MPNLVSKTLEIRDSGTLVPALAISMASSEVVAAWYLHYRAGYSSDGSTIVLMDLNNQRATSDPYEWQRIAPGMRTMHVAHVFIEQEFANLKDGDVVDVEYLLGITKAPKVSERAKSGEADVADMLASMAAVAQTALDENAALKVAPVVSTDCKAGDHEICDGEESALWPDGDFTMRPCSCECHTKGGRNAQTA